MSKTDTGYGNEAPMRRSYRVPATVPQGPDASINTMPPINDDARDVGKVSDTWDNQRQQWVPYRGGNDHGVPFALETASYDGPLADGLGGTTQESLVVMPVPSKPDIEPVPVKIVDTTKPVDERGQFRTNTFPVPAGAVQAPQRLIGSNPKRSVVRLKVVATGTDVVYVGNSEKVDPTLGWPLNSGQTLAMNITEQVWIIGAVANVGTVTVYVMEEWTQIVKPE